MHRRATLATVASLAAAVGFANSGDNQSPQPRQPSAPWSEAHGVAPSLLSVLEQVIPPHAGATFVRHWNPTADAQVSGVWFVQTAFIPSGVGDERGERHALDGEGVQVGAPGATWRPDLRFAQALLPHAQHRSTRQRWARVTSHGRATRPRSSQERAWRLGWGSRDGQVSIHLRLYPERLQRIDDRLDVILSCCGVLCALNLPNDCRAQQPSSHNHRYSNRTMTEGGVLGPTPFAVAPPGERPVVDNELFHDATRGGTGRANTVQPGDFVAEVRYDLQGSGPLDTLTKLVSGPHCTCLRNERRDSGRNEGDESGYRNHPNQTPPLFRSISRRH